MADQPPVTQQQLEQAAADLRKKLAEAGKAKRQALANLQAQLAGLKDATAVGSTWGLNEVRVLESAIASLNTVVQTQDMFSEQLALDQFQLAQEFNSLNQSGFMTAAMVETLVLLLKEKGVTTDDELKAKWEGLMGHKPEDAAPEAPAQPHEQFSDTPLVDLLAKG